MFVCVLDLVVGVVGDNVLILLWVDALLSELPLCWACLLGVIWDWLCCFILVVRVLLVFGLLSDCGCLGLVVHV